MTCLARRHNDQMMCHHCGLVWDVNDPEPLTCLYNRLPDYLQRDREDDELSLTEAVDKFVVTDLDPDVLLNSVREAVGRAIFDEYARRVVVGALIGIPAPPPPRDVKGGAKSFFQYAQELLRKTK